jgi:Flp pilus assembly protein TadG
MSDNKRFTSGSQSFAQDEAGGMTVLGLFMFIWMLMLGGLALDAARGQNMVTLMQNTADSAALAAMVVRPDQTESEAKVEAIRIASLNMPARQYGTVLADTDIEFGRWNGQTRQFTPQPGSMEAVRVSVRRTTENQNALQTTLMRFLGIGSFDLVQSATVVSFNPECLREGFVADRIVDIQSGSQFTNGFCIHSNRDIKISQNNFFEPGVSVSMPSPSSIQLPNSGFSSNVGLEDALTSNRYNIMVLDRLQAIIAGLQTPGSRYIPSYITSDVVVNVSQRNIGPNTLTPGRIHRINCSGNQSVNISGVVLQQVVLVTNCQISFGQGTIVEDAVIATEHTGDRSINGPSGVQVGRNDNCGTGGGAQLLSMGSMTFANGFKAFGAQLLAKYNINVTADSGGVQGAAFVAGGTVSATSGGAMRGCGGLGMEDNFRQYYARLVD